MPDFVDLTDIIKTWAKKYPLEKDQKRQFSDYDKVVINTTDINWKHFRLLHDKPVYDNEKNFHPPKSHVLFTSAFTNDTNHGQAYHFKTERRTKSSCVITLNKGIKIESAVQIKLMPPNPVLQANAGFKGEMQVTQTDGQSFDEELTWSIDTMVNVPPLHHTTASLVIREDDYRGRFTVRSQIEGRIHVTLRNPKDGSPVTTITGPVKTIFTADKGFISEKKGVSYVTKGTCRCRFGIEQQVVLKQIDLDTWKAQKNSRSFQIHEPGAPDGAGGLGDSSVGAGEPTSTGNEEKEEESEEEGEEEEEGDDD